MLTPAPISRCRKKASISKFELFLSAVHMSTFLPVGAIIEGHPYIGLLIASWSQHTSARLFAIHEMNSSWIEIEKQIPAPTQVQTNSTPLHLHLYFRIALQLYPGGASLQLYPGGASLHSNSIPILRTQLRSWCGRSMVHTLTHA
jgi:hypothetical protein